MDYRIANHCTTGVSPSLLLLGRTLRTRFNLLFPLEASKEVHHTLISKHSKFKKDDAVNVRDYRNPNLQGCRNAIIVEMEGTKCRLEDSRIVSRHLNQIRSRLILNHLNTVPFTLKRDSNADPESLTTG